MVIEQGMPEILLEGPNFTAELHSVCPNFHEKFRSVRKSRLCVLGEINKLNERGVLKGRCEI